MFKKCVFPHTLANKATGLLLFIGIPLTLYMESIIPIVIIAISDFCGCFYLQHSEKKCTFAAVLDKAA
jgi:hypothetical protein